MESNEAAIETDVLSYVVTNSVAHVTLNRPSALNALTVELKLALIAALRRAGDDAGVRAVVLTGAGRGFCVGQDLREHLADLDVSTQVSTVTEHYNPIVTAIATLPKPVIAAVNGPAAGAGAAIAFACDLRLAADDASFLMAFARVGLGADSGASWTLQRLIGHGRATAMMLLAEPVAAHQALEMGMVNAIVPADSLIAAATELAERLAAGPTAAYAAIKAAQHQASGSDLATALETEAKLQSELGATLDHRSAVAAFVAKQPVTFVGH